jgi:hypothetical protein
VASSIFSDGVDIISVKAAMKKLSRGMVKQDFSTRQLGRSSSVRMSKVGKMGAMIAKQGAHNDGGSALGMVVLSSYFVLFFLFSFFQ